MSGTFVLRRTIDGQFYFYLTTGPGQVIVTSERYLSASSAKSGIESARKSASSEERYERRESGSGEQSYFLLMSGTGKMVGRSEIYTDPTARDRGIESAMTHALGAGIDDRT